MSLHSPGVRGKSEKRTNNTHGRGGPLTFQNLPRETEEGLKLRPCASHACSLRVYVSKLNPFFLILSASMVVIWNLCKQQKCPQAPKLTGGQTISAKRGVLCPRTGNPIPSNQSSWESPVLRPHCPRASSTSNLGRRPMLTPGLSRQVLYTFFPESTFRVRHTHPCQHSLYSPDLSPGYSDHSEQPIPPSQRTRQTNVARTSERNPREDVQNSGRGPITDEALSY